MNEKLTAYALNELPPDERAALEEQMQNDASLRQQAEEVKAFCSLLNEQINHSDSDTLKPEQRTQLLENFQATPKIIRPFWRRPSFIGGIGLAAAACVALMLAVHEWKQPQEDDLDDITLASTSDGTVSPVQLSKENAAPNETINDAKLQLQDQNRVATASASSVSRVAPPPLTSVFSTSDNDDLKGASGLSPSSTISSPAIVSNFYADKDRDLSIAGITKSGSGSLAPSGDNSYSGATKVTGGVLAMNADLPSPTAPVSLAPDTSYKLAVDLAASPAPKPMLMADSSTATALRKAPAKNLEPPNPTAAPIGVAEPAAPVTAKSKLLAANDQDKKDAELPRSLSVLGNEKTRDGVIRRASPIAPGEQPPTSARGGMGGGGFGAGYAGKTESSDSFNLLAQSSRANGSKRLPEPPASAGEPTDPSSYARNKSQDEAPVRGDNSDANGLLGRQQIATGTQTYRPIIENAFLYVAQQPLSTFSLDVDTASYANVRRMLNVRQRPPADAVRLEELINYFPYSYEAPKDDKPFAVHVDIAQAPWQPMHRLARVAVKGREIKGERQPANFVFLLDVSGSMQPDERLPLIKQSLRLLVDQLRADDRVAIVTYAGESGVALPSTSGSEKEKITHAINHLRAGGSTNGASGIRLAYEQAALNFSKERINRVILATDGDFNVGTSSVQELEKIIAEKAKSGVFLSVLGVGTDNLHDHTMQAIADRGNGNYHYLDSLGEARKVLVEQMTGTLVTIAKDVKVQIEFNPAQVAAYRLIGYEKRLLAKEDFNNDKKDAGEIGAGHTITALYEIVPASLKYPDGNPAVDDLRYAQNGPSPAKAKNQLEDAGEFKADLKPAVPSTETLTVKLRYKQPDGDKSQLIEIPFTDNEKKLADSDKEFQFAVSVAGFGMLLRDSQHAGELTWEMVRQLALSGKGPDEQGWRGEFIQLIEKARGFTESR